MKIVTAELSIAGKDYLICQEYEDSYPDHTIEHMWTEGNYGCDCNKSLFIQQQIDSSFPQLPCGETVVLRNLAIKPRSLTETND
jgi:hypothetical protein